MTDREALYQAILANPDEDTPRLAFADFLDEQGTKDDALRADVIRTHCRLAREEPWSPPWRELQARWSTLRPKVHARTDWVAHLKGRVKAWEYERGLIGHVTVFSKRFVAEGEKFFERDPIRSVKFVTLTAASGTVPAAELFACGHLARVAKLNVEGSGLKDKDLARLAASPHVAGLRSLWLGGNNPFGPAALAKLLKALAALSELSLDGNYWVRDSHVRELARCPGLARVTLLGLGGTEVSAKGIAAVLGGRHAANLAALWLDRVMSFEQGPEDEPEAAGTPADGLAVAEALAGASLPGLAELNLNNRMIGNDGLDLLAGSAGLPALRRLSVEGNGLGIRAVRALAKSALGQRLFRLDLSFNRPLAEREAEVRALFPNAVVSLV